MIMCFFSIFCRFCNFKTNITSDNGVATIQYVVTALHKLRKLKSDQQELCIFAMMD